MAGKEVQLSEQIKETIIYESYLYGCSVKFREPLSSHTSMGIGGNVLFFLTPVCVESLIKTVNLLSENNIKIKTLGKGTNIIAADKDLDFAVIATSELSSFKAGNDFIRVESGSSMKKISRKSFESCLSGIEFLSGIPGSIGGGIRMNAGAYGEEIGSRVLKVRCLDPSSLTVFEVNSEEMDFGYRSSIFKKKEYIVLDALLKLKKESAEKIERSIYDYESKRVKGQPIEVRSAGSVFKKPFPDFHVGQVIEEIGLKGKKSGGLMISEKHAGFIINFNNGTFDDFRVLSDLITEEVFKATGVLLEKEIEIWE